MPFVTRSMTSAFGGFASSRFGPTVPFAPASFSVWQLVQPAVSKTFLPSRDPPPPPAASVVVACSVVVGGGGRRRRGGRGRPVVAPTAATPATEATYAATSLRVVAGDEVGRHARRGCFSPVQAVVMTPTVPGPGRGSGRGRRSGSSTPRSPAPRPGEGVVEVRADLALRARVGERVARAALLDEQLLARSPLSALPAEIRRCRTRRWREPRPERRPEREAAAALQATGAGGAELLDRLVARRVDGEHPVETGDLEDLRDVAVAAHERQLAVARPQPLDPADEYAERRRVDEGRVGEVDDHLLRALADHVEQLLLELGRRVEVDLARQRDDVCVALDLLRLDVEVHVVSLGSRRSVISVRAESNRGGRADAALRLQLLDPRLGLRGLGSSGAIFRNLLVGGDRVGVLPALSAACAELELDRSARPAGAWRASGRRRRLSSVVVWRAEQRLR